MRIVELVAPFVALAEKLPFTWMELRSLGNSHVVQASVLFPLIGYLILFNKDVSNFLSLTGLEHATPASGLGSWIWTHKLHFIYFGLMSLDVHRTCGAAFGADKAPADFRPG